jgi:hypothetical protein
MRGVDDIAVEWLALLAFIQEDPDWIFAAETEIRVVIHQINVEVLPQNRLRSYPITLFPIQQFKISIPF